MRKKYQFISVVLLWSCGHNEKSTDFAIVRKSCVVGDSYCLELSNEKPEQSLLSSYASLCELDYGGLLTEMTCENQSFIKLCSYSFEGYDSNNESLQMNFDHFVRDVNDPRQQSFCANTF